MSAKVQEQNKETWVLVGLKSSDEFGNQRHLANGEEPTMRDH